MTRLAIAVLAAVAAHGPAPAQQRLLPPAPVVSRDITVLREWAAAVSDHEPGDVDAPLRSVVEWPPDALQAAWIDVAALIAVVKDREVTQVEVEPPGGGPRVSKSYKGADLDALQGLAADVRRRSLEAFVKRAAVLHSDIATRFDISIAPLDAQTLAAPRRMIIETDDGRQERVSGSVVHWEMGRMLLAHVPDPRRDDFVRVWYQASLAFKVMVADLDTAHFESAVALFPGDPVMRFLEGALHDALAHPAVQSVIESARLPSGLRLAVRSEGAELRDAERAYRRASELDPSFAEARLRRGRLLARQGRHREAAAELRAVLPALTETVLAYYCRLFLAGVEETLGRLDEAQRLYQEATRLYPAAQSPHLALSQLAHRRADRTAARRIVDDALASASRRTRADDPWWMYQSSAGRKASESWDATYRLLPR